MQWQWPFRPEYFGLKGPPMTEHRSTNTDPAVRNLLMARLRLNITPLRPLPLAAQVRGALAHMFPELDLLHQHGEHGLIYRSPRVIYSVDEDGPLIIAVEEGAEELMKVRLLSRAVRMGNTDRMIMDTTLKVSEVSLGQSSEPIRYRFRRPWLALNQENHRRYEFMPATDRIDFLNKQLGNNCLALAKSFGVRITERLLAQSSLREVTTKHKGMPMLGFVGEFAINFHIPQSMGLGKSVSKGFGSLEQVQPCSSS